MILEYSAPGARRHTHAAGTTDASLLGLLDVGNHKARIVNHGSEVNGAIGRKQESVPPRFRNHLLVLVNKENE